jgi:arsenite transporter
MNDTLDNVRAPAVAAPNKRFSFLDRDLTLWILAATALGVALGSLVEGLPVFLDSMSFGTTNLFL